MSAALVIASLIPTLFQAGLGAYQTIQGNKWAKEPTPDFQIPEAVNTAVSMQRRAAQGDMAGMQSMISAQRQSSANAINEFGRYGMLDPNTVGKIYGAESENIGKIGVANENWRDDQKNMYLRVLGNLAEQQGKEFEWETLLPYQQKMQAASALTGSGIQNMYGSMESASDKFGSLSYLQAMGIDPFAGGEDWFSKLFNRKSGTNNKNFLNGGWDIYDYGSNGSDINIA